MRNRIEQWGRAPSAEPLETSLNPSLNPLLH